VKRIAIAGLITLGLILWAHQLATIGGRVPMVFVALWFGSATMVALVFMMDDAQFSHHSSRLPARARSELWRHKMRFAAYALLPFALVPLIERSGVPNDPAVWLLDAALFMSLATVPYFTLVARTVLGGVALSVGAFQALWICGASAAFRIMERAVHAQGGTIARGAAFEEFFRRPQFRYLFFSLSALMLLGYCPAILVLGYRRFVRVPNTEMQR
jgi:hypothetical protein